MWTKIAETGFSGNTGLIIDLNTTLNLDIVKDGDWLVITPFNKNCELRKIVTINSTTQVAIDVPFAQPHSSGDLIFIQTSPVWDITLFGARANDSGGGYYTQNTIAINAAVKDCDLNGGGIVAIPTGTYELERFGGLSCCVNANKVNNIMFVGEGMDVSILKLAGIPFGYVDIHMFQCNYSTNLEWRDLTLAVDENADIEPNHQNVYPQAHLIFANGNNPKTNDLKLVNNFIIDSVSFLDAIDDGVWIMYFNNLVVHNCYFYRCGRSGITGQRDTANVWVNGCYFYHTKNSDIDMEPTFDPHKHTDDDDPNAATPPSPNKWMITENIFDRNPKGSNFLSVSLTGIGAKQNDENFIVSNNVFQWGAIVVINCRNVICDSNIIIGGEGEQGDVCFYGLRILNKFVFTNNILKNNSTNPNQLETLYLFADVHKTTLGIEVTNNVFEGGECHFENCANIMFTHNNIKQRGNIGDVGVRYVYNKPSTNIYEIYNPGNTLQDYGNIKVTDNKISNVRGAGIKFVFKDASYTLKTLHIDHNVITGSSLLKGIEITVPKISGIEQEAWTQALIGTSNLIDDCTEAKVAVSGNWQMGMSEVPSFWVAKSSPNGVLPAMTNLGTPSSVMTHIKQGSIAIDKTREADNKYIRNAEVLYDSGITYHNRGWELQSETGRQILFKDTFHGITSGITATSIPLVNPPGMTYHKPEVNVFSGAWTNVPTNNGLWSINTNQKVAKILLTGTSGGSINVIDSISDCEIKMYINAIQTGGSCRCGIVFRLNTSVTPFTYWRFCFEYISGACNVRLETINNTSYASPLILITLPDSGRFLLKILCKGDYVSAFYNDLLMLNIKNGFNTSMTKHGMICNSGPIFSVEGFNMLLH